jgi:mono/diheme cytochrome c family protein
MAFSALALVAFPASLQQAQKSAEKEPVAEFKIPPEAVKQVNPVKPTSESVARGKRTYGFDCAMCHGKDGDGKGDLAADMHLNLRDYRDSTSLKDMTDGELSYIITKGKGQMTGEEGRMKSEAIWDMVNYIRSLAKKETRPKSKGDSPTANEQGSVSTAIPTARFTPRALTDIGFFLDSSHHDFTPGVISHTMLSAGRS